MISTILAVVPDGHMADGIFLAALASMSNGAL